MGWTLREVFHCRAPRQTGATTRHASVANSGEHVLHTWSITQAECTQVQKEHLYICHEDSSVLNSEQYDFFGFIDGRLKFAIRAVPNGLVILGVNHPIARVIH